jgi:hypothetical protein
MNSKNKRGALQGIKLIFSLFIIIFILTVFYVWVKNNIEEASKNQAEVISVEVEMQNFFSELINKNGIEIAEKSPGDVETIIEKYAENYIALPKGSYDASCSSAKECTLSITSKDPLKVVASWSLAAGTPTIWLLIKAIGLNVVHETSQQAYLPIKPGNAMKFTLTLKVKWG